MAGPPLSRIADFFTQPHMLPGGEPETFAPPRPASGDVPPGPPVPLPPILQGVYRAFYPTPAETGELPQRYWPQQQPSAQDVANSLYRQG